MFDCVETRLPATSTPFNVARTVKVALSASNDLILTAFLSEQLRGVPMGVTRKNFFCLSA
ncbi:hypothetical protein PHSC3_001228 [Chlamydiales bacterium STE3]|nr:hypothetical protein PHSC3_001228 [Chlamydiales bacterium STE3]